MNENWNEESNQTLLGLIGLGVKRRRLRKNISQKELSLMSGVSKASITRFETGTGNISLDHLLSILKTLEMADELKKIFQPIESSPTLLAKAGKTKIQERVRKKRDTNIVKESKWVWV